MDGITYYINTKHIDLEMSNTINEYIATTLDYDHSDITEDIQSVFQQSSYDTQQPIGVVIHDTGTDKDSIDREVEYMVESYETECVFVHTFIDEDTILRIADEDYEAQGAGANANPYYNPF